MAEQKLFVVVFPPNFGAEGWDQVFDVPFSSKEDAVAHMTEYTATWQPWSVGEVTVVHSYTPPEDE